MAFVLLQGATLPKSQKFQVAISAAWILVHYSDYIGADYNKSGMRRVDRTYYGANKLCQFVMQQNRYLHSSSKNMGDSTGLKSSGKTHFTINKVCAKIFKGMNIEVKIDDSAKGGLTQFCELFTMIPCVPKYLKR